MNARDSYSDQTAPGPVGAHVDLRYSLLEAPMRVYRLDDGWVALCRLRCFAPSRMRGGMSWLSAVAWARDHLRRWHRLELCLGGPELCDWMGPGRHLKRGKPGDPNYPITWWHSHSWQPRRRPVPAAYAWWDSGSAQAVSALSDSATNLGEGHARTVHS